MQLYLDANAHLPMSKKAIEAYVEFNNSIGGHGHAMSPSSPGRAANAAIEKARDEIAGLLGAESANQIVFTSTCTQACEWGLEILATIHSGSAWITPMEHVAVRDKANGLFKCNKMLADKDGNIKSFDYDNDVVISTHIQNEIGTIVPIDKYKCKRLFVDMCQSPGKIGVNLLNSKIDIAVFGAHKFGGPASIGFMYLRDTSYWKEFGTGSRYYFDRAGTPDAAGVVATAAALKEAIETLGQRYDRMVEFRTVLESGLEDMGMKIIGKNSTRCPNTTFFRVGRKMAPHVLLQLGAAGIHVGLGSACGSLSAGSSPLMTALGQGGSARDYMRISQFGEYAGKEATYFLSKLRAIYPKGGDVA